MLEYLSKNLNDTDNIAQRVAGKCVSGDIYLLSGDLGSGKTTFTKSFLKHLGLERSVTSPTFVIAKEYTLPASMKNITAAVHIDAYRLTTDGDALDIGLPAYLDRENTVILIEWPEKIIGNLPAHRAKRIFFRYASENERYINLDFEI